MLINFGQVKTALSNTKFVDPKQLFSSLPSKSSKYGYLRDVQSEVLEQWHDRRQQKDLRLKMNTGGGKTVVGLLILKSSLNEGLGPAVYVAPTPYLATQVRSEAAALGITVDDDPRSTAVLRGNAILVTHIQVLLNGRSKFGVGDQGALIPIGSLVLDDAHACLATAEQQFTLTLDQSNSTYKKLLALFHNDFETQSQARFLDVLSGDPHKSVQVPFWAWQSRIKEVREILHTAKDEDEVKFALPLLSDDLQLARCVMGRNKIEISPRCIPIRQVPSFADAKRRVFMSATFADDSILISHFDASPDDIATAISPKSASDLGERMILVPQEINPRITDLEIKAQAVVWSKTDNVVVIVPSHDRAGFWKDTAANVMGADALEDGVMALRSGHVGLAVIVNKYDGIDLPDSACRVLILDGLPDARRLVDRLDEACLKNTEVSIGKSIQLLEQGMGRGVRSNSDYCGVILMGRTLIGNLFVQGGLDQLTPATRAQFDLSESIGQQLRDRPIGDIAGALDYCLIRNTEWVAAAKGVLAGATYATESSDLTMATGRRKAWDEASLGNYRSSEAILTKLSNSQADNRVKGWLLAEAAEYENHLDQEAAQKILKSAVSKNKQLLLRPKAGLDYVRINTSIGEQASASLQYVRKKYKDGNSMIMAAHAVADDLVYRSDSYKQFEKALTDAALFLGFSSQMPEDDFRVGPDVLWSTGNLEYFVIECKNEATTDTVSKEYCNQLAGSANWFATAYDSTCKAVPILFHPSKTFEFAATPPKDARVVTSQKIVDFREAFMGYCLALGGHYAAGTPKEVGELLGRYNLLPKNILLSFTEGPVKKPR
jgi:DEAD/DEAH box helicase/Helicase C-terminal domain